MTTEAELTAAYEADIHARGQKTLTEMNIMTDKTRAQLITELIDDLKSKTEETVCLRAALKRTAQAATEYRSARLAHDEIRQQRPIKPDTLNASTDRVRTASANLDAAIRSAGIEGQGKDTQP